MLARVERLLGAALLVACLSSVGCGGERRAVPQAHAQSQLRAQAHSSSPANSAPRDGGMGARTSEPVVHRATLASVGDVLPHLMVKGAARSRARRGDDGRDANHRGFDDVVRSLRGALDAYDLASFNMESPVVREPLLPHMKMRFFADPALPAALRDVGFDVAICANNHAFDQGAAGLVESYGHLRELGLGTAGCGPDLATASEPLIREVSGIRIAIVSFARILNGYNPARREHPEWPQILFWYADGEPARQGAEVLDAVRRTRARGDVDVVVVDAHWDREYQPQPLPETRHIGRMLVDAGADLVVGHHPHVLQPAEWVTAADGRRAAVIYSHGNFIHEMCAGRAPLDLCDRRLSAISVATFEKREGERARLAELVFEPAWMDHRAVCPDESEARSACVRPVLVERELERIDHDLLSADASRAAELRLERRGYEVRRDVIRRFMGPHEEGQLPRTTLSGSEHEVRGRGRDARALAP